MPAALNYQTATSTTLDGQQIFTRNKANIAQTAFDKMRNYNPVNLGTLNIGIEWICPEESVVFMYNSSNNELFLNGNPYSSLNEGEKAIFHRWLPHFTKQFVIRYNKEFNI